MVLQGILAKELSCGRVLSVAPPGFLWSRAAVKPVCNILGVRETSVWMGALTLGSGAGILYGAFVTVLEPAQGT